jgi:hypothetical protein
MPKLLLVALAILLGPLVLVAVVLLVAVAAPCAVVYFCFARACDCIEEFRPRRPGVKKKSRRAGAAQLGQLLTLLPQRATKGTRNNTQGRQDES